MSGNLYEVAEQRTAMETVLNITQVFEGLASMHISQTRNQVLQSQGFFKELWHIYTQLRVVQSSKSQATNKKEVIDKQLYIAITSEGGFSGDIDHKLIKWMLESYNPEQQDIIVIGYHGATQLTQAGVNIKKYFALPPRDRNINVLPLAQEAAKYKSTTVYYQTYESLMVQDVKKIELILAVQNAAAGAGAAAEVISEDTYIFEPSPKDLINHLEHSMTQIALSQLILDSKLAQYASRFRAMSLANDKAGELSDELKALYNRTKRRGQDERLKELMNGLRGTSK